MAYLPEIVFWREIVHLVQCVCVLAWVFFASSFSSSVSLSMVFLSFFAPLFTSLLYFTNFTLYFFFVVFGCCLSYFWCHTQIPRKIFCFCLLLLLRSASHEYEVLETWMDMAPLQSNQTRQHNVRVRLCVRVWCNVLSCTHHTRANAHKYTGL